MTKILIVDDSPIDRRLVGELLSKNPGVEIQYAVNGANAVENTPVGQLAAGGPCLQLDYAENGREALAALARRPADLVITDLLMPEINGLQLVAAMREIPADPGHSHDLAGQRGDCGPGPAAGQPQAMSPRS